MAVHVSHVCAWEFRVFRGFASGIILPYTLLPSRTQRRDGNTVSTPTSIFTSISFSLPPSLPRCLKERGVGAITQQQRDTIGGEITMLLCSSQNGDNRERERERNKEPYMMSRILSLLRTLHYWCLYLPRPFLVEQET